MGRKEKVLFILVCLGIFFVSLKPVTSYDTFFGLKIGELVFKTGQIPSTEVFSWSAQGRNWIAYEWLGQSVLYLLTTIGQIGQISLISFYVASLTVVGFIIAFLLSYKARRNSFLFSVFSSFFLISVLYEFFVARPQIIGFVSFLAILFLIFDYLFRSKNRLWLAIPILYIWTNSHASFILGIYLLFGFGVSGYIYHFLADEKKRARKELGVLGGLGILGVFITLLPPLFGKPYLLLWQFFGDMGFMTTFVSEWQQLFLTPLYFYFYFLLSIFTLFFVGYGSLRDRKNRLWILLSPLFILILFSFSALRHYPLGIMAVYAVILVYLGDLSPSIPLGVKGFGAMRSVKVLGGLGGLGVLGVLGVVFVMTKREDAFAKNWFMPKGVVPFLQQNKIEGLMYNDFAMGGYLLYHLYPQYQIFYDGRADIYHKFEMRDYWELVQKKNATSFDFKKTVFAFLKKYNFSFFVFEMDSFNPLEFTTSSLFGNVLLSDPRFKLIYFDDHTRVIVDTKDSLLSNKNVFTTITPFQLKLYPTGQEKEAVLEYQRMVSISDSGMARLGLGEAYFSLGDFGKSEEEFTKAIQLNPYLGRAILGLGKIDLEKGKTDQAILNFEKAVSLSPYLGDGYLLLGKTYSEMGKKDLAVSTLEKGLKEDIDLISRREIVSAIEKIR